MLRISRSRIGHKHTEYHAPIQIVVECFTFHSSRMATKKVTQQELAAMSKQSHAELQGGYLQHQGLTKI